jgi:N-acyl-D-aspartate/D-glutamate deacylase
VLELLIRNGLVVDGTGAGSRVADVGVHDGRIVTIGRVRELAREQIDADGLVVSPGFIDVHTHYDAQVMWDPLLSPSSSCGVTTVVSGNCGFSIAPLGEGDTDADADYVMRMLARVEGIPVAALTAGPGWDWTSFGSWLARLEGNLAVNAGFYVGHSTLRRAVMGEAAVGQPASPAQLAAMVHLLGRSLDEGGLGFSTTRGTSHNDHRGDPVPSRFATHDEFVALAAELRRHPRTSLGIMPTMSSYTGETYELMTAMAAAAERPLFWNAISVRPGDGEPAGRAAKLASADHARARGAQVFGLALAQPMRMRLNLASGVLYDSFPGWAEVMHAPLAEKMAALRDPSVRAKLRAGARDAPSPQWADWANATVVDVHASALQPLVGRRFGDIAAARGLDPFDTVLDVALEDQLQIGIAPPSAGDDDESWAERVRLWRDSRVVIGGSDAGAHLDMMSAFNGHLAVVGEAVRDREVLGLEEAVHLLTGEPAARLGLSGRGRLVEGAHADVLVFDAARIGPAPVHVRHDLPGGAWRIYGEAEGIEDVIVNGVRVLQVGQPTGARPGAVVRPGRR